ncbi:hypothetical protein IWQ60_012032, partial [Tieghemiomyces parasiticus]
SPHGNHARAERLAPTSATPPPKRKAKGTAATPPVIKIVLDEAELSEKFIRGRGNGGQKVNKTSNCVQLVHSPTGIQITCHETRSLDQNRKIARKRLVDRLDQLYNGEQSKSAKAAQKKRKGKQRQKQRSKKRLTEKQNVETPEEVEDTGEEGHASTDSGPPGGDLSRTENTHI